MFYVHTKTPGARFEIPPVWSASSKTFVFVMDYSGLNTRPNPREKLRFQNFPAYCEQGLRRHRDEGLWLDSQSNLY